MTPSHLRPACTLPLSPATNDQHDDLAAKVVAIDLAKCGNRTHNNESEGKVIEDLLQSSWYMKNENEKCRVKATAVPLWYFILCFGI